MIRKALINDVKSIHRLINNFAKQDLMLPRSLNDLYESLRDFWVSELNKQIVGCCALAVTWQDLAEIRSLAVEKRFQQQGIGAQLIDAAIREAKEMGVGKIFALTYQPGYFKRFGFKQIRHSHLPHKIWVDCINCPKFPNCKEVALIKKL